MLNKKLQEVPAIMLKLKLLCSEYLYKKWIGSTLQKCTCFFKISIYSIMVKSKEGGIVASWESGEVTLFCDLCIKEIGLGNRPTTHFSKEGWKNLIAGFKERTRKSYDRS
ncbi:hypothetical protein KSP39_PZI009344 [Platanthera zijinensis]|uniref:Myb/SANT-like domain-containing protein n=1 Tax=Platanthera zijinensis TaxID=2320716 RepID=A0AAP0BMC2_9ASPA